MSSDGNRVRPTGTKPTRQSARLPVTSESGREDEFGAKLPGHDRVALAGQPDHAGLGWQRAFGTGVRLVWR